MTATAADSTTVPHADFNGDGVGDVAFSAAGAYVNGRATAGQLVTLYGTATGVSSAKRSTLSQDSAGVPGTAEAGDAFSAETAYADFNGDGYDDLAVSSPGEKVGSDTNGGTLAVLWGSASGLTGKGVTVADPAVSAHDYWGKNLAAGDFDGDGTDDLAVGNSSSTVYVYKGGISASGTAVGGRYTLNPRSSRAATPVARSTSPRATSTATRRPTWSSTASRPAPTTAGPGTTSFPAPRAVSRSPRRRS